MNLCYSGKFGSVGSESHSVIKKGICYANKKHSQSGNAAREAA